MLIASIPFGELQRRPPPSLKTIQSDWKVKWAQPDIFEEFSAASLVNDRHLRWFNYACNIFDLWVKGPVASLFQAW